MCWKHLSDKKQICVPIPKNKELIHVLIPVDCSHGINWFIMVPRKRNRFQETRNAFCTNNTGTAVRVKWKESNPPVPGLFPFHNASSGLDYFVLDLHAQAWVLHVNILLLTCTWTSLRTILCYPTDRRPLVVPCRSRARNARTSVFVCCGVIIAQVLSI